MRRQQGALLGGVLPAVLCFGLASAAVPGAFAPPRVDLSAQLFARCFGETLARGPAYNASPLRGLAFETAPAMVYDVVTAPVAQLPQVHLTLSDPAFAPPPQPKASVDTLQTPLQVPNVSYYESADPVPTDAPATERWDLDGARNAPEFTAGNDYVSVKVPVRFGHVQFAPHAAANPSTLSAGTTFNLKAGRRSLGLDLSSSVQHVNLAAPQYAQTGYAAGLNAGLGASNPPVFVPAFGDVNAQTISTGVSVPVTRALTASVQYDTQHLLGAYGVPGAVSLNSLDASNTIYGAQLTFKLPKSASLISLAMRQYRYQDNLLPVNALTQTNANLNFTIKF